jgi:hypothetical protein
VRGRVLAANGIRTRHYALDEKLVTLELNEELAATAARRALADRGLAPSAVRMLAAGTTQGDVLVPGFASMVHGRLGGGPMEVLSAGGVCASGMAALKAVVGAVRLGEHPRHWRSVRNWRAARCWAAPGGLRGRRHRVSALDALGRRGRGPRGARAAAGRPEPAGRLDPPDLPRARARPCMSAGLAADGRSWLDRDPLEPASVPRAPSLRQDMSMLPELVDLGVAEFTRAGGGRTDPGGRRARAVPLQRGALPREAAGAAARGRTRRGRRALVQQPVYGGEHRFGQHLHHAGGGAPATSPRETGCCCSCPSPGASPSPSRCSRASARQRGARRRPQWHVRAEPGRAGGLPARRAGTR